MKTIKLPYKAKEDLTPIFEEYSNVVRNSYNYFLEGKSENDIKKDIKKSNKNKSKEKDDNYSLNSYLIKCGIKDAKSIQGLSNKHNLINKLKNKIFKKDPLKGLLPINVEGDKFKKGNKSFKLDINENNRIIFKLNKKEKIELKLPKLRKKVKIELSIIEKLNEVKKGEEGYEYSVKLDSKNIYISFKKIKYKKVKSSELNKSNGSGFLDYPSRDYV